MGSHSSNKCIINIKSNIIRSNDVRSSFCTPVSQTYADKAAGVMEIVDFMHLPNSFFLVEIRNSKQHVSLVEIT